LRFAWLRASSPRDGTECGTDRVYRVERDLVPGMATVYLARDPRHDRDVVRSDPASRTSLPSGSACGVRRGSRSNPAGIFFR
jgi:hypothetical protein